MSVLPTLGISARDLADCFEVCLLRSFPNHTSWILHATRRRRWLRRSLPLAAMVSRPGRTNEAARGILLKSYRCMAEALLPAANVEKHGSGVWFGYLAIQISVTCFGCKEMHCLTSQFETNLARTRKRKKILSFREN